MILADTSVWIDHFRAANATLGNLLGEGQVLGHPFVLGELALGNIRQRQVVLRALGELPQAVIASDDEVLGFIDREKLFGRGVGYVDTHLLAAVRLTPGAVLWAQDKRLNMVASQMGLAMRPIH